METTQKQKMRTLAGRLEKTSDPERIVSIMSDLYHIQRYGLPCTSLRRPKLHQLPCSPEEVVEKNRIWLENKKEKHGLVDIITVFFENQRLPVDKSEKTHLPFSLVNTDAVYSENNIATLPAVARLESTSRVPVMELLDVRSGEDAKKMKSYNMVQQLYFNLVTSVPISERVYRRYPLVTTVRDLVFWLWPDVRDNPAKYKPSNHLKLLNKFLLMAKSLHVIPREDPERRAWQLIGVWQLPTKNTSLDAEIEIEVVCPPDSHRGPRVLRESLVKWAGHIHEWRTLVRLHYYWDLARFKHNMNYISYSVPSVLSDSLGNIIGQDNNFVLEKGKKVKDVLHPAAVPLGEDNKPVRKGVPQAFVRNREIRRLPPLSDLEVMQLTYGHQVTQGKISKANAYVYRTRSRTALHNLEVNGDIRKEEVEDGTIILPPWNDKLKQ